MEQLAPEDLELRKKHAVLDRLKDRLAIEEEQMTDLRRELEQFEAQYTMQVGRLYADLDEIEAQIAEEEYKLVPDDEEIKKKAEELRLKAEESAARAALAEENANHWQPTPDAKRAFRDLARVIHPDLALDPSEKEKRHTLMAELNRAYSDGDQKKLNKLVEDFRNSPGAVTGDSIGDELVRAIRQISQVKHRLLELRAERLEAVGSEIYTLREKMAAEAAEGRDMIKQMAARTQVQIRKSERRLANLRNVNAAAEEYVKDKYGLDISSFRE
ncbi:MAG: hypothetical protein ABR530_07475 [Pyrinomonadaceae bacterium]